MSSSPATSSLYRHEVALTQKQFKTGIADRSTPLQAEAQLNSTLTQRTEVRRQRADEEHAIAILVNRPPAEFSLPVKPLDLTPPVVPAGLPADLLRQRPDVAEAELNLMAASANIGVAVAAFYPTFKLTGDVGYESLNLKKVVNWQSRMWAAGADVSAPIYTGGLLTANLQQARAKYQELQATYRYTVLGAFSDVENALTDLHMQADEAQSQALAVDQSRGALDLVEVQYQKGLINYLLVITSEQNGPDERNLRRPDSQ